MLSRLNVKLTNGKKMAVFLVQPGTFFNLFKLLLSIHSHLCVAQYGEIGR